MSHQLLSRIPLELQHCFRIYEFLSKKFQRVRDREAYSFFRQTAPFGAVQRNWRMNVAKSEILNPSDFPPIIGELIAPIFRDPLQNGTDSALLQSVTESLISSRNHTFRHFSDYQAKMLLSFASSLNPCEQVLPVKSALNSFKWYQHLLSLAPVTIFLKQEQNMMSEPSLLFKNTPFENLRDGILLLSSKYNDAQTHDMRVRNYYLTDLVSSDLFGHAIISRVPNSKNLTEVDMALTEDQLYKKILSLQKPIVTDVEGRETGIKSLKSMVEDYPMRTFDKSFLEIVEPNQALNYFPYNVNYNDIFLLKIESPVINDDHNDVLQFIKSQSDFEVFAVRVSSDFTKMLEADNEEDRPVNPTYDDLLHWTQKRRKTGPSGLMQAFSEWGLVEVYDSISRDSLYLFK